jgi:pyruvate dehydrogenase E2 component (dihydrolipoamide acetyltransferase)
MEVVIPEISEGVDEGTVVGVLVAKGEVVEEDQSLVELETDKAVVAIPAPAAGRVTEILVSEGDTVVVGAVFLHLDAEDVSVGAASAESAVGEPAGEAPTPSVPAGAADLVVEVPTPSTPAPAAVVEEPAASKRLAPAAPSVRRVARELGVDIDLVHGSGPRGRISVADVRAYAQRPLEAPPTAAPLPDFTRWGPVEREPLSKVREVTARAMSQAWRTVPQVTQYDKADITEIEEFRQHHNARRAEGAAKLTMTAILLKVAVVALREFPRFNSSLDWERRELIYKRYHHIGVAVDTPHGLLVPTIRDVDHKGLEQLTNELAEVAARTRERRVRPDELEGGTFTISNLGGIGGTGFSPIVYAPQVAILGVSRASMEPVWRGGEFQPRLVLPLSLTYDHRVIDGADGARFLRWICEALQHPLMMMVKE